MFGINGGEWLVIGVLMLLVVGPQRLPETARTLASWIRRGRQAVATARSAVDAELDGAKLGDLDPRRVADLVRQELTSPPTPTTAPHKGPAPFDDEAT